MHHVFTTMGTVASVTLPDGSDEELMRAVEIEFESADATFSLYRADSELSHINSGRLQLTASSTEVRRAYADAMAWGLLTGGAFTPNRPDGAIDLNGIVKALAIQKAGVVLDAAGIADWSVNVGGDMLFRGCQPAGQPWRTGIVDPADRQALLCAVDLPVARRAVATSGGAEHGDHIWRGGTPTPPEFIQVTVLADSIIEADVIATAIIAGGPTMLDEMTQRCDIDVLAVYRNGDLLVTPGFRAALSPV